MSFRNTLLVLLFGGTLGMWLLREQPRGTLEPLDRAHREFLKANPGEDRAPAAEHPSIVFARLDDGDLQMPVFDSWPLSEKHWLNILQNVPGYAPTVTAIDAVLTFPKATGLLDAAAKAVPGLTVPALLSVAPGDGAQALPESLPVLKVHGDSAAIPEFKSLREAPLPGLAAAGQIDMQPRGEGLSVEGDLCRVPMLARMGDKVVPTLALRALLAWAEVAPADVTVQPGAAITAGKALRIEIDAAGRFGYYLSLAPRVESVNVDAFALTREQSALHVPAEHKDRRPLDAIKGSLLWLGLDDVKSRRLRRPPNETPVSPAELTARALAVIQTNSHLLPLAAQWQWIAPAGTLLFCVWLTHWRKSRLWPGALVAVVALTGVSLWLYRRDHLWLPIGPSLGLVLATLVLSYILPSRRAKPQPEPATRKTMRSAPTRSRTRTPAPVTEAIIPLPEPPTETAPPPEHATEPEDLISDPAPEQDAPEEVSAPQQIEKTQLPGKKGKKKRRR